MIAYKVLAKIPNDPQLRSAWMQDPDCCLEYALNTETFPLPSTGILAFRTLPAAQRWAACVGVSHLEAAAVLTRGEGVERPLPPQAVLGTGFAMTKLTAIDNWNNPEPDTTRWSNPWPTGTVALESFTPTKEI